MVQEAYDTHPAIRRACDIYIGAHAAEAEGHRRGQSPYAQGGVERGEGPERERSNGGAWKGGLTRTGRAGGKMYPVGRLAVPALPVLARPLRHYCP
jgi:hypothetical protein